MDGERALCMIRLEDNHLLVVFREFILCMDKKIGRKMAVHAM